MQCECKPERATRSLSVLIVLACGLLALLPRAAAGWPNAYSSAEIQSQVVDEKTGAPIEGAVVNARWFMESELFGGRSRDFTPFHEFETITDKEGKFRIPGWGPKVRGPTSRPTTFAPLVNVFKAGYYGRRVDNAGVLRPHLSVFESDWNGKSISLNPFDGSDWRGYIHWLNLMWSGSALDGCFNACPRMVLAVYDEWSRIEPLVPPEIYRRATRPPDVRMLPAEDREFLERAREASGK